MAYEVQGGATPMILGSSTNNDGMWGGGLGGLLGFALAARVLGIGYGGYGDGGGVGLANQITNEFLFTNLNSTLDIGFTQVANQVAGVKDAVYGAAGGLATQIGGVKDAVVNNTFVTQAGFQNISSQLAQCCCENLRAIDGVNFNAERNTCAIVSAINNSTQTIKDILCNDRFEAMEAELNASRMREQSAYIIAQLKNGCGC